MYRFTIGLAKIICIFAFIAIVAKCISQINSISFHWTTIIFFFVLSMISRKSRLVFQHGSCLKIDSAINMLGIYIFGPSLVALNELLVIFMDNYKSLKKKIRYASIDALGAVVSVFVSGLLYANLGGTYSNLSSSANDGLLPLFAATWVYLILRSILATLFCKLFLDQQMLGGLLLNTKCCYQDFLVVYCCLAFLFASYFYGGLVGLVVFMVIYLLVRLSVKQYNNLRESYFSIIGVLSSAIDAKDTYTRGHSERVTIYAVAIAREMNLGEKQIEILKNAALLHDVGKIGISERILDKPKELTDDESIIMKRHPVIGEKMLSEIKFLSDIGYIVRAHHEKYDGTGYPDGLKGDEIPLLARIIAVADTFDAMVLSRPYRKACSVREAINEIKRSAGTQLDPDVVNAFLTTLDKADIKVPMEYSLELQAFEHSQQTDNGLNIFNV